VDNARTPQRISLQFGSNSYILQLLSADRMTDEAARLVVHQVKHRVARQNREAVLQIGYKEGQL
jgi:hypothetical protein